MSDPTENVEVPKEEKKEEEKDIFEGFEGADECEEGQATGSYRIALRALDKMLESAKTTAEHAKSLTEKIKSGVSIPAVTKVTK